MTDDNYVNAIDEAQKLLNELLNDPDHGKLTFKGLRGLDDLIITEPRQLGIVATGSVIAIGVHEWMALSMGVDEYRLWQGCRGGRAETSEQLYLIAARTQSNLSYCHAGL
jgi:hypothetical protein